MDKKKLNKMKVSDVTFVEKNTKIEHGLNTLTTILFENYIYNLYSTFDKLRNKTNNIHKKEKTKKEKEKEKEKEKNVPEKKNSVEMKNGNFKKQDISISKITETNIENAKKQIEQSLDLILIILNTLKGDPTVIQQFVLENYTKDFTKNMKINNNNNNHNNHIKSSSSNNSSNNNNDTKWVYTKNKKEKKKKRTFFYDTLLISRLYEYSNLSKEREEENKNKIHNCNDNYNYNKSSGTDLCCFEKKIQNIENEKILILKDITIKNLYLNNSTFSNIDTIWEQNKKYTKCGFFYTLNNMLTNFYLNKNLYKADDNSNESKQNENFSEIQFEETKFEETKFEEKKFEEQEFWEEQFTNDQDPTDMKIRKLFFEYFNNIRKNEHFNILLEEVNINNMLQFYNILIKALESVQSVIL